MSLITEWEVIKSVTVKDDFPTGNITKVKDLIEEQMFCDWLGSDFYDVLKEDLADHSDAVAWNATVTYTTGIKVIYEGCVFVSLEDNNQDSPVNSSKWAEAEKFKTDEYNLLWPKLKTYLAYQIIGPANIATTWETDSGGTREVFNEDSGRKTPSQRVFQKVDQNFDSLGSAAQSSLIRFIEKAVKEESRKVYYDKVDFLNCHNPMAQPRQRKRRWIAYRK